MASLTSIRIEGGLLGPDILDQLLTGELPGQRPGDFGLDSRRNLTDEIAAIFADARALWGVFQNRLGRVSEDDPATSITRDAWAIPFLGLLGYELHYNARAHDIDGQSFAISHRAGEDSLSPPVHIVGARQDLGRIPASGRPRMAPHSLLQEYLNRDEHVWGLVTNGLTLRLLRDCTFVRRQAYVEFDLPAILDEQRFQDFAALYRLLHRSRMPRTRGDSECFIEQYYSHSQEQGGRVREHLREGVEECIRLLANGFLGHPASGELQRRVSPDCTAADRITADSLYRQLLTLVYRFLFLLVSEDRGLLSTNPLYHQHYGIARLRRLLEQRANLSADDDVWQSLRVLWQVLIKDQPQPALGNQPMAAVLGLPVLNGDLFAPQALDGFSISNAHLLSAFRNLAWYTDRKTGVSRRVNYGALDVEELGSVYESLLELHPILEERRTRHYFFDFVQGGGRKETGSYYTPPQLVNELIVSALEPVIADRLASSPQNREQAILSIRVCDPACGSGHFLLAAARRLGKELARIRTDEAEPAPERVREAIRDVVSHCIYGVDRNPLAVDLCRVALWLESHTADRPLTFLDHRIRCGDSLVGVFDLSVLSGGLPDKAFEPCEGDDKAAARAATKQNREERRGAQDLFAVRDSAEADSMTRHSRDLDAIPDNSAEQIRRKKELFEASHSDPAWLRQKQACDLWTAAYFQSLAAGGIAITSAALADHLRRRPIDARFYGTAATLSLRQRFFHWPLEFPEVFAAGGFDVVLSNPPWEMINLMEKEFFAARDPRIGTATGAKRKALIAALRESNPTLFDEFTEAVHIADAMAKFVRHCERFRLTAAGRINTYAVFAQTIRCLLAENGRAGVILPTGIATDETTKNFFSDLIATQTLQSLTGYENEEFIFPAIANVVRFCIFVMSGAAIVERQPTFAFYLRRYEQRQQLERFFRLSSEDLVLLNPNTRTCPIFRSRTDAELTRTIYRRLPILLHQSIPNGNPWQIRFMQGLFNLTSDSHLFHDSPSAGLLPVYEGKFIWHFDHRFASFEFKGLMRGKGGRGLPDTPLANSQDPSWTITPQHWVAADEVEAILEPVTPNGWLLAFRDITSAKLERTAVFSFVPRVGVGNNAPLIISGIDDPALHLCLLANLNSLVFDFCVRQKIGGTHMNFFIVEQFPIVPPATYHQSDVTYVGSRALELVYTADDMRPLADAIRESSSPLAAIVPNSPFRWDDDRRVLLRAELDAWFARAYGLTRDELRYVLDPADVYGPDFPSETFRVLKEKETAKYGEFRTRRMVLEAWDRWEREMGNNLR